MNAMFMATALKVASEKNNFRKIDMAKLVTEESNLSNDEKESKVWKAIKEWWSYTGV